MVDPKKRRYMYISMAVFSAIAMGLILFFILLRLQGIGNALNTVSEILAPFVYGGVIAYLLRPLCNTYESFFTDVLPLTAKLVLPVLRNTSQITTQITTKPSRMFT